MNFLGMAVDNKSGNVFVSGGLNSTVNTFSPAGNLLSTLTTNATIVGGVAIDQGGHVFVTDSYSYDQGAVYKYESSNGSLVWSVFPGLSIAKGLAFDSARNTLYVADTCNSRIVALNATDGSTLFSFGSYGSNDGQFEAPNAVVLCPYGLAVADRWNARVSVHNVTGEFIRAYDLGVDFVWGIACDANTGVTWALTGFPYAVIEVATNTMVYAFNPGNATSAIVHDDRSGILYTTDNNSGMVTALRPLCSMQPGR